MKRFPLVVRTRPALFAALVLGAFGLAAFAHAARLDAQDRQPASTLARLALRFGPPSPLSSSLAAKADLKTRRYQSVLQSPSPEAALEACITNEMTTKHIPGAAAAVMKDGELVFNRGYGMKKPDAISPQAVNAETQFRIGSITKMMTAAAVMQQVEAGKVNLDDPLVKSLPGFMTHDTAWTEAMTVRHALSHATGYPDDAFVADPNELGLDGPKEDDALDKWANTRSNVYLHTPPGTLWNYSNPNFMLAAAVAEKATGKPYHRIVEDDVWAKAGLTNTVLLPDEVLKRGNYSFGIWTNPFTQQPEVFAPDSYDNWPAAPAGYAFSTAGDLVRWADLLMTGGGQVLRPESVAAMTGKQQYMDYRPYEYYGFGVFYDKYESLEVRQHGGNIPGWGGYLAWVPSARFAVALLNNSFPASMSTSAYCAIAAYLKPAPEQDPSYRTPPSTWSKYVGVYGGRDSLGGITFIDVRLENDRLSAVFPDNLINGQPYTSTVVQALLDTFLIDLDGDGQVETDMTFIADKTESDVRWLRMRQWVGRRPALVPHPTPAPITPPAPTATPGGDLTLGGLVYNRGLGEDHPIAGARVSFSPCVPHQAFSALSDESGHYRLLLPSTYVASCGNTIRIGVTAQGFMERQATFALTDLYGQPNRNFGLDAEVPGIFIPSVSR